jgi:hypothetical protein
MNPYQHQGVLGDSGHREPVWAHRWQRVRDRLDCSDLHARTPTFTAKFSITTYSQLPVFTPGNQLGSESDAGFTSEPSNSIVVRAAEAVDVIQDSDRQYGLSKVTPLDPAPLVPSMAKNVRWWHDEIHCSTTYLVIFTVAMIDDGGSSVEI